ncbi:24916_t:CDS:2 [Entrophospora sp. SA101]|nr:14085_t:CDS:2 [Entrophospora sp. SA101]CAJ0747062.1 24916_t:CDS:2 [Entrophospora sp. SA101]CAJ0836328.1 2063_t:CDS:2 [Entrophospora sp. SA101]
MTELRKVDNKELLQELKYRIREKKLVSEELFKLLESDEIITEYGKAYQALEKDKNYQEEVKLPCLVISNDQQNEASTRIIIIPLTSQPVSNVLHIKIKLAGKVAYILPEQIRSVSKKRVKSRLGKVSKEIMQKFMTISSIAKIKAKREKIIAEYEREQKKSGLLETE